MPRLYIPSTVVPLLTPQVLPGWTLVQTASGQNGIAQPGLTAVGDVILYWGYGGTMDPDGPDGDGSWTLVLREQIGTGTWVGCWARITATDGADSYTTPAGGIEIGTVAVWRPDDPLTTLAVATAEVAAGDTGPTTPAVPGALHVVGFAVTDDSLPTSWATDPPTFAGRQAQSGFGGAMLGFVLASSGVVGGYEPAAPTGHASETSFIATLGEST